MQVKRKKKKKNIFFFLPLLLPLFTLSLPFPLLPSYRRQQPPPSPSTVFSFASNARVLVVARHSTSIRRLIRRVASGRLSLRLLSIAWELIRVLWVSIVRRRLNVVTVTSSRASSCRRVGGSKCRCPLPVATIWVVLAGILALWNFFWIRTLTPLILCEPSISLS